MKYLKIIYRITLIAIGISILVLLIIIYARINNFDQKENIDHKNELFFTFYTVKQGDTINDIALAHNINPATIMNINNIRNSRAIPVGRELLIPNMDGFYYNIERNDTIDSISIEYNVDKNEILRINKIENERNIYIRSKIFIPISNIEYVMSNENNERQNINNIFIWPINGMILYNYGNNTLNNIDDDDFYDGIGIAAPYGTPIRAARAGRVESVGYDNIYGNFIIIRHSDDFKTLYGHLSSHNIRGGDYVDIDTVIGFVGSTGHASTANLHFIIYRNGESYNPILLLQDFR